MIDDASPDATIVSYFWLVNNTLYRISKECSKGRKNFHELSLAFSNSLWGHSVTFYLGYSNLRDIVEPWFWMPDYIGNTNSFTDGKKAVLIAKEPANVHCHQNSILLSRTLLVAKQNLGDCL